MTRDTNTLKDRIRAVIKTIPVVGKPYVQREELRSTLQQLWEPPGHFYSPIPDLADIRRNEARVFDTNSREVAGVDLNERAQLQLFHELATFYSEQPFAVSKQPGARYYFNNPAFSYFDAIIFYGMLRYARPGRVIEVGSGYSSCLLLDTNERFFNHSIACTFIEPYPQLLTSLIRDEDRQRMTLIARNLQDVDSRIFSELSPDDILFIDSSHVSKTHSDVNYLFFEVLPRLRSGVHIHIHDIFYPFEYPKEWVYQGRAWNEAYMLRSFLQYNSAFEIRLFNSFMERFHKDVVADAMPLCVQYSTHSMIPTSAQSLWLTKRG
jgi:predicted O-methyltransferase YrrM